MDQGHHDATNPLRGGALRRLSPIGLSLGRYDGGRLGRLSVRGQDAEHRGKRDELDRFLRRAHLGGGWSDANWSDPFGTTISRSGAPNIPGFGDAMHATGPTRGGGQIGAN